MSDTPNPTQRRVYTFAKIALVIISILGLLITLLLYPNWGAEREARAFCDGIASGSDISLVITRFEEQIGFKKKAGGKVSARHYGFPQEGFSKDSHTFLFPGFMFDKAECTTSLNQDGKVTSKYLGMQHD